MDKQLAQKCKGEQMREETGLTLEEKNCLRLWFRQAIAAVEMEEAQAAMLKLYPPETDAVHRVSPARKRPVRKPQGPHSKELAY
jgi:hypothetical protein